MEMGIKVAFVGPFIQKTEIYKFQNDSALYNLLQEPLYCSASQDTISPLDMISKTL